jgi:hypothetical protein
MAYMIYEPAVYYIVPRNKTRTAACVTQRQHQTLAFVAASIAALKVKKMPL